MGDPVVEPICARCSSNAISTVSIKNFDTANPGQRMVASVDLGHFQVGSYRYRSLIEGLYTL